MVTNTIQFTYTLPPPTHHHLQVHRRDKVSEAKQ